MTPLQLETLALQVVGHALLTILRILVAEQETAAVLVSLSVVAGGADTPRPLGVDLSQELQVPFVVDREILTNITPVESAGALITIARHDKSTAVALGEREETVGDGQGQRHVTYHEIGRSEHHVLSGAHLGTR